MRTNKFNKFMVTPLGTLVRHFFFIVLSLWLVELQNGHDLFQFDLNMWRKFATAGVIACLPTVMNWLNADYKNYGK
jgi:hypothetical protein